jgi:hypothetical protein
MAYLAYVQPSRVIYNAIATHTDDTRAANMYVVLSHDTPLHVYRKRVAAGDDEAASIVATLQCGEVVRVSERHRNGWVKLCAPVVGWTQRYTSRSIDRIEAIHSRKSEYKLQLCQLSQLAHARHGSIRPHGKVLSMKILFDSINC